MNKTIDIGNGITAVINRNSEYKDLLTIGKDFFCVDTASLSKIFPENDWYWSIIKRESGFMVSRRDSNRKELRLSRFLTNMGGDRSSVVMFANEHFYDLRMKNLLVVPVGGRDWAERKRAVVLPKLDELPMEIKNGLAEQNATSSLQGSSTANSFKINRKVTVTLELNVTDEVTLQYCPSTDQEEKKATEMIEFLRDNFTVVQR